MGTENILSIEIPPEELKAAQDALQTAVTTLAPYILALTSAQRKTMPKMSDGTLPFVGKVMDYVKDSPQFAAPYLNKSEMEKDFNVVSHLIPLLRTVDQFRSNLRDTTMLAGSEAFVASLSYYNSVKMASKMNVPGAKPIYEDLSQRFARSGRSRASPELGAAEQELA